ncbi:molybdate transport system regulatory protein [Streptomyces sp. 3211.6]|uniref:TOBE domain-containing protein n=1 Tax=Streptomyces TaxID=1883 RepID=UPI0009A4AD1B|nr:MULTISPECIES: TOBE domain-containing protein [Streptomyces]RKT08012.1 molybdate transport system regulatory protein [Streptomyces sp. 3211.6]RPF44369.1 molybdate transport system regulatory protein [Streptomyces sp. Ag109_G2-6]
MTLSIRNQISGTVTSITAGEAMSSVKVRLEGGQEITAVITTDAAKELGLAEGAAVKALVKATEVSLATGAVSGVSIRNQIPGTVVDVAAGPAMASVKVDVNGGGLTAAITADAVKDLGLAAGTSVVALIKATEISLAAA